MSLKKVNIKDLSQDAQEELIKLSKASITIEQMRSGLEQRFMMFKKLKAYFTLGLGNFFVLPIEQLTITDTTYPISQLFQEISKDKVTTFFDLSKVAANQ